MPTDFQPFTSLTVSGSPIYFKAIEPAEKGLPKEYIINENACVCFWNDGTKTVSKRFEDDTFDKELGFLLACWKHYNSNLSKNSQKRILACIRHSCLKDFLLERFRVETEMDTKRINDYLLKLKVTKSNKRIDKKIGKHMKEDNDGEN